MLSSKYMCIMGTEKMEQKNPFSGGWPDIVGCVVKYYNTGVSVVSA